MTVVPAESPTPAPCTDLPVWQQAGSTNTCTEYCLYWCDGDSYTSSHPPDNGYLVFATDACCCCGGGDEYSRTHVCIHQGTSYADITHPDTYLAWWSTWDGTWSCPEHGTCKCSGMTVVPAESPFPAPCTDLSHWGQAGSTNTCAEYCLYWCDGDSYTSTHIPDNGYLVFPTDACCCCGGGQAHASTHVCVYKGELYADITHPDTYLAWWATWEGTWACSRFGTCKCSGSSVVRASSSPGKGRRRRLEMASTVIV